MDIHHQMFNDFYDPPIYTDDYGFKQGAQNDLWDSLLETSSSVLPVPSATTALTSATGQMTSTTTPVSVAAVSSPSSTTHSDPYFVADVGPLGMPDPNTAIPSLNETEAVSAYNTSEPAHSTSPIQHLLADPSSRKIRGCRARRVSGSSQGGRKRSYVVRKRATKEQKGWGWWAH